MGIQTYTYAWQYCILASMLGVYVSLFILGLAAVDPIGIAAMPVLLSQERPYRRSVIFLGGSFTALVVMGLVFSRGLGSLLLHLEQTYTWIIPTLESLAGAMLLFIALILLVKQGSHHSEPSGLMMKRLRFGNSGLFGLGVVLVSVQSIVDVVFLVAMIRVEALHLSLIQLVASIIVYAGAALLFQIAVVIIYRLTPLERRKRTIQIIQRLIERYANHLVIGLSVILGVGLLIISILTAMGRSPF